MPAYSCFPLPAESAAQYIQVLQALKQKNFSESTISLLTTVWEALIDHGLDYFFVQPPERLQTGVLGRSVVKIGVKAAEGGLHMIVARLMHSLSDEQLERLAIFMDGLIFQTGEDNRIGSPLAPALAERLQQTMKNIRQPHPQKFEAPMVAVLKEMTDRALEYYFETMTHAIGIGEFAAKVVHTGLQAAKGGLHLIISKIIHKLNETQMQIMADFLEEQLLVQEN